MGRKLESKQGELRVLASAPIIRQAGGVGGDVTISRTVDLTQLRARLKATTSGARLEGLQHPVELVALGADSRDRTEVSVPVPATALALHAAV